MRPVFTLSFGLLLGIFGCKTADPVAGRVLDAGEPAAFPSKPTTQLNIAATIDTGFADWMGTGFGSLWTNSGGFLKRIDPATHQVVAQIKVNGSPYRGVGVGLGAVWIPSVGENTIQRIDPATNLVSATYPITLAGGSEGSIGVGEGAVWAVTSNGGTNAGTLTRMDPATGKVVADIPVSPDSHGVLVESGFVWVTSYAAGTVIKVDPATNTVVADIPVKKGPRFLAGGLGAVWVLCQGTGTVARIDPATNAVVADIDTKTPGGGGDVATGEGAVWVTVFGKPVTRIDPLTNTVVAQFVGNGFGDAIRAGEGYVWVSGAKIWQITP